MINLINNDHGDDVQAVATDPDWAPVHLDNIRRDGQTQTRVKLDAPTVAEYADLIAGRKEGDPEWGAWPFRDPIVLFRGSKGDLWLADGFHRVAAWARVFAADPPPLLARILNGDRRAAVLYAAGANADHGLRRSKGDKRRSVEMLLSDPEWAEWSDRQIARACNVSPTFVGNVRRDGDPDRAAGGIVTYVNGAGNVSQMDTTKIAQAARDRAQPKPDPVVAAPVYVSAADPGDEGDPVYVDLDTEEIGRSFFPPPAYTIIGEPPPVYADAGPDLDTAIDAAIDLILDDPDLPAGLANAAVDALNAIAAYRAAPTVLVDSDPDLPAELKRGIWTTRDRETKSLIDAAGEYELSNIDSAPVCAELYNEEADPDLRAAIYRRFTELGGSNE